MKKVFPILILILAAGLCPAQQAKPDEGPPAKWVVPITFNARAKLEAVDSSQEMRWILKDRQINAQNNETFRHEVRQVLTVAGLNNGSHVAVEYEPSYQLLTFHWVRIWRGTNVSDRLDADKIQTSQRGLDPEELLFRNDKTALILLSDVRVGDVIDYAYTVQGANPVFAGRFSGRVEAEASQPIDRMTTRLLWPVGRKLYVKNHGTDVKYKAVNRSNLVEFTWTFTNVPGRRIEPPVPGWFQPLAWIQLSEFQKWADVNQLLLGLFTNTAPFSPDMSRLVAEWKKLPSRENQVLAALRLVQDDVRYLGLENGVSGYKPAPPASVLSRRFGDCKDKTFLLATLLRGLGIEAHPALVDTSLQRGVFDMHPSATVFDHAITQVTLDGQVYWLDATANYERGPLAVRSWPYYGCALVLKPGTTGLTPVAPSAALPRMTVTQYITLRQGDAPADLKVVTVADGRDAEQLRASYMTTARDQIERANLNYYAVYYPDIIQAAPLVYSDNEALNRVEVDEFYTVRKIWSQTPGEQFYHCRIYPENIIASMRAPPVSLRAMPLAVAYPVHEFFHAEVTVPVLSVVRTEEQTINNPAFHFYHNATIANGKLMLNYEYQALADTVMPPAVPDYVRQLNAASEVLGYIIPSD